jgi:hypothetical protein
MTWFWSLNNGSTPKVWRERDLNGGVFKCRVLGVLHSSCAQPDAYLELHSFAFPIDQRQPISNRKSLQIQIRI